jgi:hypothetical protein
MQPERYDLIDIISIITTTATLLLLLLPLTNQLYYHYQPALHSDTVVCAQWHRLHVAH